MIEITDLHDHRIAEFASLKKCENGQIVADSHKVITKLILSGLVPNKFLVTHEYWQEHQQNILSSCPHAEVFVASEKLIEKMVGYNLHHGVMAKATCPEDCKLADLDEKVVVLNGLTSPENVGSIIRSAAAFGIRSVIVDEASTSPWMRRAIRVSMGNVFFMKVYHSLHLVDDLKFLADAGYQCVGTANSPSSVDLPQHQFKSKTALIIGSEGHGMTPEIYHQCHLTLRIPMLDDVAHLNAAAAASICLYQLGQ